MDSAQRKHLERLGKDGYVMIGLDEYEEGAIRAALAALDKAEAERDEARGLLQKYLGLVSPYVSLADQRKAMPALEERMRAALSPTQPAPEGEKRGKVTLKTPLVEPDVYPEPEEDPPQHTCDRSLYDPPSRERDCPACREETP